MSQTCNHVVSSLFHLEAACRLGLTNPSCTLKTCEWLPANRNVALLKIKDMKLSRNDFGKRGNVKRDVNPSPKKRYDPLNESNYKLGIVQSAYCFLLFQNLCPSREDFTGR